jgi:urea transport system ATP-binding protein
MRARAGRCQLDGQDLPVLPAHRLAQMGIGYVPQGRMIFPLLTVRENLETGFACLPKGERTHSRPHLRAVPCPEGDGEPARRRPVGRAAAAACHRARAHRRPRVLLMDEPTEGIQPNIIQLIGRVIRQLREEGEMAIILVEQYFDFAFDLADRFYVLSRGSVVLSKARSETDKAEVQQAFDLNS